MLEIWGRATSSNVQKVMWVVAELELEHRRHDVGDAFGGNDTPEFLAMNPNGLVPVIKHDDMVLWESHSIVRYLAARFGAGNLCPEDMRERAMAERWMDWFITTVAPDWATMWRQLVRTPPSRRDMKALDAAVDRLGRTYQLLDRQLDGREYIMGGALSIADVPLGVSLYRFFELKVERPEMPNLDAWYARLCARPAYAEHAMVSFESLRVTD